MLKQLFNSQPNSTSAKRLSFFAGFKDREEPPEDPDTKEFILQPNKSISALPDKQKPLCAACGQKPRKTNNKVCSLDCLILYVKQRNPDFWHQIQLVPGEAALHPDYSPKMPIPVPNQDYSPKMPMPVPNQDSDSPGIVMPAPHLDTNSVDIKGLPSACLICYRRTTDGTKDFCEGACVRAATANEPLLLPVPEDHHAFEKVVTLFKSSRPTGFTVYSVTRIFVTSKEWKAHQSYRADLDTRKHHPGANIKTIWTWDAPCRTWDENTNPSGQLCGRPDCKTCCRVNGSLNKSVYCYPRTTAQIGGFFKDGFYYDIVCEAALGRTFQDGNDTSPIVTPPQGYDSAAQVRSYDYLMTITAQNAALLPLYIVFFKHDRLASRFSSIST